jgi:hypothetical protein
MKEHRIMKHNKLYDAVFPIWLLLFFPPVIFITLVGNFIIDSIVILACYDKFKLVNIQNTKKTFYQKSILKVWAFGLLADIVGTIVLFIIDIQLGSWHNISSAISFDPFSDIWAVIIIIFAMLVSALCIFFFNYKITFKDQILNKQQRLYVALTISIITMPWTFLLPTKWFFHL